MFKKRNLIFLSLLILGVLLITGCLSNPPVTEGILKGQVLVPEGSIKTKDLTDQALPGATVNIIDLAIGDIIATAITDTNGYYQVFVPAGGPYLLEAVKNGVKVQQCTPQVEAGIEYDLGTADCSTTAVALIAQAMLEAEDYPNDLADISLAEIEADPYFNDVMSIVYSAMKTGVDLTESALVHQAIENFLANANWRGSVHNIIQDIYYTAIQAALDAANSGDIIEVDDGTYAESITFPDGKVITLRSLHGAFSTIITGVDGSATVTCGFLEGTTTLEGFTINHESGNTGRGITITAGYLTINNCWVSDNSAIYGGGIANEIGTLTITGSTIVNNSVSNYGGGIYNDSGFLTITGSTISANVANHSGGGIYNGYSNLLTIITNSTITGNSADYGGGIFNGVDLTITNSTITGNSAEYNGGGILNNYTATSTITGSTISGNSANRSGGGMINDGILTITGSTISGNSGNEGGGICNTKDLTITGSTISGNSAPDGSGIYNYGTYGYLTITGSTISGNSGNEGGGIYNIYNATLTITDSTITGNSANNFGGGIYNNDGTLTITGSTISSNSAIYSGGGIYLYTENNVAIGGINNTDLINYNHFTDNYKEGSPPSADQHICNDDGGDCRANYPYNYFIPGSFTFY
jgi:hypothetical protein